jgi:hypothetical protein
MNRTVRYLSSLVPLTLGIAFLLAPAPAKASNGNDIVSYGNSVTIREGQEVTGDLVVFGGDAKVYGHVDGDAVVMGGDLYIAPSGQVDGSTVAFGGSVDNESTQTGGHHKHQGGGIIPPIPKITPLPDNSDGSDQSTNDYTVNGPPTAWYTLLGVLGILSLLAFAIAPGTVRLVRDEFVRRPLVGTVVGFCWPFILTAVMIALAITIIGIVLMPAVLVAVAVAYLLGRAAIAQLLGRRLFEVANVIEPAPLATTALGLVIITVVEAFLPYIWMGIVLEAIVSAIAIGAAMLPFLRSRQFAIAGGSGYVAPPTPVFTPPAPPPPSGPPAVPQ